MQSDNTKYEEITSKDEALHRLWNKEVSDMSDSELSDALGIFRSRREAYKRAKHRRMRVLNIMKYAALLIAPIITAYMAWHYSAEYYAQETELTQYYVPDGRIDSLTLSDNTQVKIDAGTSIIYPAHFSRYTLNRNVYINGRCHFAVTKDPMHPFIVNMCNLKVRVLGTHFSVESYNEDDHIKVTLEEGLVEVFDKKQAITLHPNEQLVYNRKDGTMHKNRIDALAYNSWIEGNVDFTSQPLSGIIKTLERRYGVKFTVAKNINLNRCYTMNFRKGESIEQVLKVLSMISGSIHYIKNGNIIQLY